jgi:hypothetical protein
MEEQDLVQGAAQAAIKSIQSGETAEPEQSSQEPSQTPQDHVACMQCGYNMADISLPTPAEEERREYLRCILGKRPYKKTYTLYEGEITISFELLSQVDSARMAPILAKINQDENATELMRMTESVNLKLLFYLRQFNDTSYKVPETFDKWREVYTDRFSEFDESVPALLIRVLLEFLRLADMLPSAGLDENFWKGAGLA